jgi:hypothetical protein
MSVTELDRARGDAGWPNGAPPPGDDDDAASVAERGEDEPMQDDLFPKGYLDGDEKVTFKNLIRAGEPVEVTASLMTAEVPLRGGIVNPRKPGQVLVSYQVAKLIPVPQRDGEPGSEQIVGWKVRCQLRPTYVEPATGYYSREQVLEFFAQLGVPASSDKAKELLGEE